jgi:hypothetical protein
MKLLAPILVFLIAAQPAAAGFCDMDAAGDSPAQAAMAHHGETQGMDDSGSHDCCDTERGNEAEPAVHPPHLSTAPTSNQRFLTRPGPACANAPRPA